MGTDKTMMPETEADWAALTDEELNELSLKLPGWVKVHDMVAAGPGVGVVNAEPSFAWSLWRAMVEHQIRRGAGAPAMHPAAHSYQDAVKALAELRDRLVSAEIDPDQPNPYRE